MLSHDKELMEFFKIKCKFGRHHNKKHIFFCVCLFFLMGLIIIIFISSKAQFQESVARSSVQNPLLLVEMKPSLWN